MLPTLEIEDLVHAENIGSDSQQGPATWLNGLPPAQFAHLNLQGHGADRGRCGRPGRGMIPLETTRRGEGLSFAPTGRAPVTAVSEEPPTA